jgi:hypothetical protein
MTPAEWEAEYAGWGRVWSALSQEDRDLLWPLIHNQDGAMLRVLQRLAQAGRAPLVELLKEVIPLLDHVPRLCGNCDICAWLERARNLV